MKKFRITLFAGYVGLAILCFLASLGISALLRKIGWATADSTPLRKVFLGVSGAATLIGIIHPVIIKRSFVDRGRITLLGRKVTRTFDLSESELVKALRFPWLLTLILGLVLFTVNLLARN